MIQPRDPATLASSCAATTRQARQHRQALDRLQADPRACLVFVGPRGSGKSTQLAHLVPLLQALDAGGESPLVISAGARRSSRLSTWLPGIRVHDAQAMDAHTAGALVIDEASSLPLPVLDRALSHAGHLILASTMDGYEPTGRAFAGRFLQRLATARPGYTMLHTRDRFRFAPDALERSLRSAFLLDALATTPSRIEPVGIAADIAADIAHDVLTVERLDRPLRRREALAAHIVALLGATHYRTGLDELDPVLDGRLQVWVVRHRDGRVIATATLAAEGVIPPALHADVLAGRRRLHDQLLPQLLARSAADASALGERYLRVVRIAVLPGWRRHGIATRLVQGIREDLAPGVALGSCFGDGADVARFWRHAGLQPFHRGLRVNPKSGQRSVAVLEGGTARTRAVLDRARAILADNWAGREDASRDAELLLRFARGERGMAETLGPLNRAWRTWTGDPADQVLDGRARLGLPLRSSGRRLERALVRWARAHAVSIVAQQAPSPAG